MKSVYKIINIHCHVVIKKTSVIEISLFKLVCPINKDCSFSFDFESTISINLLIT